MTYSYALETTCLGAQERILTLRDARAPFSYAPLLPATSVVVNGRVQHSESSNLNCADLQALGLKKKEKKKNSSVRFCLLPQHLFIDCLANLYD